MKILNVVAMSLVASLVLVGCGSSNDSVSKNNTHQPDNGNVNTDNGNGNNNGNGNTDNGNGNTDNGGAGITSLPINEAKDIYGYRIFGKINTNSSATSTVLLTFNCNGSYKSVQTISASGYSETITNEGKDRITLAERNVGNIGTVLDWNYDTATAEGETPGGDYFILTENKNIVVGTTKMSGAANSSVTKIEKFQTCQ